MSETWPQPLKEWVAKCLGQMTDSNRTEAQAELRQVIADAFTNKTLWTTDWAGMQLQSLLPKQALVLTMKRKLDDKQTTNKKKKGANKMQMSATPQQFGTDQAALSRRAERFQREHDIERQKSMGSASTANKNLYSRIHASSSRYASPSVWNQEPEEPDPNVIDWDKHTITGTSKQVFKDYLRLTSEPDPKEIRPYNILRQAFDELKKRWRQSNDYPWICNQLKSIRQDLTVQRIKNEFTVQVYEMHARVALEASDLVEYYSCQGMLKTLYELGIPGAIEEFTAYRILMLLHGMNKSDLNLLVGQLTAKQKSNPCIKHALEVQRALSMNNYHSFFDCYSNAPNMGPYIMDYFVNRERVKALMVMCKAYHQIPLTFIRDELAFDSVAQACEFLADHKAPFIQNINAPDDEKTWECKQAHLPLSHVFQEKYRKAKIEGAV